MLNRLLGDDLLEDHYLVEIAPYLEFTYRLDGGLYLDREDSCKVLSKKIDFKRKRDLGRDFENLFSDKSSHLQLKRVLISCILGRGIDILIGSYSIYDLENYLLKNSGQIKTLWYTNINEVYRIRKYESQ